MNNSTMRWVLIIGLLVVFGFLVYWLFARDGGGVDVEPTVGAGEPPVAECPQATPEFFTVEPVTSPTDQLMQTIVVDLGNGETITVTSEAGTVSVPFDTFPKEIEIPLLPNTVHNLTVEGKVVEVQQGDCTYGGYVLSTTTDRNGAPLVIEQKQ